VDQPVIPRTLGLLWGREEPGRRGPRPGLTLEAIAGAAIGLADASGLRAVSMKRVAEAVGVSTMALYRYVDTKDDLFLLMAEFASGPAPGLPAGWRAGLEGWCRAYRALLVRHPWLLQVPLSGPPATPLQLAWMEAALAAMEDIGLSPQERTQVLLQLNVYVRGDVALGLDIGAAAARADSDVTAAWAQQLQVLADPDDYPAVHAMLATGEFDEDDDPLEQFEFGLARALDGVALLVQQRKGTG
jgi:AcrR family transcriptional regulator